MFSNYVALWSLLALIVLRPHADAALTRRQYPPPSSNPTAIPPLSTAATSTQPTSPGANTSSSSSPASSSASRSSSTSSTSSTLYYSSTLKASSNSSTASTSSVSRTPPTTTAAESNTKKPVVPIPDSSDTYNSETSKIENFTSSTYIPSVGSPNSFNTKLSITSAPATHYYRPLNSSFPITSGPTTAAGNASIQAPYIAFGCTPDPLDAWHDARSCSCQSRLFTYYATQSTGDTITTVCHTSGEESYGLQFSAGCSTTTSPLLKTPWVAPDDCCGYCKIEVPTVRIVYWAPQTAAPNASYATGNFSAPRVQHGPATTVYNGFTFTSPSVYVIYSSIHASASCIAMSQTYHTVGGTHVVTRAYPPDALSSVRCVNSIGVGQTQHSVLWEPIDYNDLYYPIPVTESLSRVDRCFTNRADNDIWGNWMRQPFISLPKDVSQLDPTWTTCSGVAIGAMDPPRALVPAAGWEDSPPPSAPADPPTPEHVTSSNPSLPKATPGKTVPDPVPRPTSGPTKGADSTTQPVPKPNTDPPQQPHESPHTQPDPPKPSSIPKEPSKSPAAVTPQPQQPAPQAPNVNPSSDSSSNNPGNSINARPPTDDNNPAVQQPSGNQGTEQRAGSDPFNSISAALFSSPSPNPSPGMQNIGGGTESQVPSGQQHTSTPNYQGGSSDQGGKEGSTSGQISPGSQNKGNSGYNPPAASPQDQSPDSNHQIHPNGQPASDTGNHAASANNDESQTGASGSSGGSDTGPDTGNGGSKGSSNGESSQQGSSPQGDNPNTKSGNRPTTFAFVSNDPAPVVGSHTIAMAPDGAAIVGTATIHPGQAQDVQGIAVSVAPNAIVVGPSIFAITTPQEAETPAAAPVVSQAPGGGLIIGSKTIMPGQKDSVNGHDVSVGPSNVVIDGKSMAFPAVTPHASIGPVNIGGVQIDRGSGNVVVIGGSTYKPGAQVTVSGHTVSIGSDEAAVAGTTYSLPSGPAGGPLLVGAQTVRKDSNDHVLIGTSTLLPGSQISMAGHVVSVGAGNKVIVDQSTYALPETAGVVQVPSLPDAASTEPLMVDGRTVSKDASGRIIVGSSTVVSGSKITIAGHVISAASSKIIVDQSTYDLPATAGAVESPAATPVTLSNGIVLTPGATAVTLSGEIISVFSNDKGFVIDGSTVTLPSMASAAQSIFTVAGQVFTAAPTGFSIGGTTVSPRGSAITISGTVVSLGLAGLQIDSQTIPLPTSTATQPDLGDVIMSAFEQDGASSATAAGSGSAGTPMPTAPGNVQSSRSGSSRHIEDAAVFFWVLAGNLVFGILVFVI